MAARNPKADPQEPGDPDTSQPEAEPLVMVYVVNGTRTSRGPGPGPLELPAGEAARLIACRFAIGGSLPPRGMGGTPAAAVQEFR
jgi:hypothetical protein